MKQWGVVLETGASFSGWTNGEFLKGKFLALLGPLTHPLLGGTAFSMNPREEEMRPREAEKVIEPQDIKVLL